MKATCQQCKDNGHDKCEKGMPFYGAAHICRGFEPTRKGVWECIAFDPDAPEFFRAIPWEE